MASVVVCPHCYLQLIVPDGIEPDARVQCPACRDEFSLDRAEPRSLPEVVRVEPSSYRSTTSNIMSIRDRQLREREAESQPSQDDDPKSTAAFSTWRTISHVVPRAADAQGAAAAQGGTGTASAAPDQTTAEPVAPQHAAEDRPADEAADDRFTSRTTISEVPPPSEESSTEPATTDAVVETEPPAGKHHERVAKSASDESASDESAEPVGEPVKRPPSKSSAATLADVQPPVPEPSGDQVDTFAAVAPEPAAASRPVSPARPRKVLGPTFELPNAPLSKNIAATVDLGSVSPSGIAASTDFELDDVDIDPADPQLSAEKTISEAGDKTVAFRETPPTRSNAQTLPDNADWQRLIANSPEERDSPATPLNDDAAASGKPASLVDPWADAAVESTVAPAVIPTVGRRRQRSALRTLVGLLVFSVGGLALGYYILLYLVGPPGDVLYVARFLPAAALPNSFRATPTHVAQAEESTPSSSDDAEATPSPSDTATTADAADDSPDLSAGHERPVDLPTELPAEPLDAQPLRPGDDTIDTPPVATESRYGMDRVDRDKPPANSYGAEPARFEEPAAAPLPAEKPHVIGGPLYTLDQLAAALGEAKAAQPGLVAGDLGDKSVRQTKGRSYSKLCELAEVLTFCDEASTASFERLVRETEDLFRSTLADAHTRGEVARIATIWIDSPSRRHGGVFLAGSTSGGQIAGDVYEYQLRPEDGDPLVILSPQPLENRADAAATQLGVVGTIVDRPAETIAGYTGDAPRAIWVRSAVPLD